MGEEELYHRAHRDHRERRKGLLMLTSSAILCELGDLSGELLKIPR